MASIAKKLKGKDFRSIGESNRVVEEILKKPVIFEEVFNAIENENLLIRMRAADAIEKVSSAKPHLLQRYKNKLIHG
jgi:hypothetical protein